MTDQQDKSSPDTRATQALLSGDHNKDRRNLAILLEAINAFDSAGNVRDYLNQIVDMSVRLTGAERGLLILREPGRPARIAAARDAQQQNISVKAEFSRSIPKQVLATGESVCLVDTIDGDGEPTGKSVRDLNLQTVMCVPLRVREKTIGVMYVDSRFQTREFSEADLGFFEAICQQVAISVSNARLHQRLIDARGPAAIGEMTTKVLERLREPMDVLQGSAAMLQHFDLEPPEVKRIGGEVEGFLRDISAMLESIQGYAAGAGEPEYKAVELEDFVRSVLARVLPRLDEQKIVARLSAEGRPEVELDVDKMERALTLIIENTLDALPGGGELMVTIRQPAGSLAELELADDGPGIAGELVDSLTEPFVTHGKRNRAGLGLTTARRIVEQHQGSIRIESAPGEGTRVFVTLPAFKSATDKFYLHTLTAKKV